MQPVVHHVELCVADGVRVLECLKSYGFVPFAVRRTAFCQQWVTKVGKIVFVVTERQPHYVKHSIWRESSVRAEPWTVLCCEDDSCHRIDTVVNVALVVRNVEAVTERIRANGGSIIQPPTSVRDKDGLVSYSIVRSIVGDVTHTLINADDYQGLFLPGYEGMRRKGDSDRQREAGLLFLDTSVAHIDHFTLACSTGDSQRVISFYERCFGMERFAINRDEEDEGLILQDGVGLRLKAMEYWRCSEVGLIYPASSRNRPRNPNGVMVVVVESLPGQTNCNVETYLREHGGPGVEHIAFHTSTILETVNTMVSLGVNFRQPPAAYYSELKKQRRSFFDHIGEDLSALESLGILLDNEVEPSFSMEEKPKYLMQIFAQPLFSRKTFFIEVIQRRGGARGLGAGNILALVRSIREEEKRKAADSNTQAISQEDATSPRRLY